MIKYGINTESPLWESIPDYTAIEYMDADFPRYDKIVRDYFRQLPKIGADAIKVVGLGWQIVRRGVQSEQQIEWFWIYIRAEFPSGEMRPYFVLQISAADKRRLQDSAWESEVTRHIQAMKAEFMRKLRGDPFHAGYYFVEEPHFIHNSYVTSLNNE